MRTLTALVAAALLASCVALSEPAASVVVPSAGPPMDAMATDVPPLVDRPAAVVPSLSPRPREPGPKVVVVPVKPNPVRIVHTERLGAGSIRGTASWYCGNGSRCTAGHSGGLYAAIRRDLLGHRGDQARVCSGSRCITVTIIDCNCGLNANLIDLYSDAFSRLAPISRGRIPVTLTWLR